MVDATSFTSTVPVPYVDATGLHIPAFADIYAALQNDYRGVYGQDVVLDPDTQDGEWIGIQAVAYNDFCAAFASVYEAYSPTTAQGVGLASIVKTNGIQREAASASTADLTVVGVAGTSIPAGVVSDGTYKWLLPPLVIPLSGQVIATATCLTPGAITAASGAISKIANITKGWQSASNAAGATPGAAVETDALLRVRQSNSTMIAATGVVDGIAGAIANLPGVVRVRVYENDTNAPDVNGVPGHSISAVVDGGDAAAIAGIIAQRKLSAGTYGTTTQTVVTGAAGIQRTIAFFRPTQPSISWGVKLRGLTGFTTDVGTQIQQALSDWTNALGIGAGSLGRVALGRAYAPALLTGAAAASFELIGLTASRDGAPLQPIDVTIGFNEAPCCTPSLVTLIPVF